jgi:predicted GNAT family N-acyltransferase
MPVPRSSRSPTMVDASRRFSLRLVDWSGGEVPLRAVRTAVFVVEQAIPAELEWDAFDGVSVHVLAVDARGDPIGCGRLLPDGHIGRMAVLAAWRGQGVGAAIFEQLVDTACRRGDGRLRLHAQTQAMPFYARFGFAPVGAEFMEAGIPHRTMERMLAN